MQTNQNVLHVWGNFFPSWLKISTVRLIAYLKCLLLRSCTDNDNYFACLLASLFVHFFPNQYLVPIQTYWHEIYQTHLFPNLEHSFEQLLCSLVSCWFNNKKMSQQWIRLDVSIYHYLAAKSDNYFDVQKNNVEILRVVGTVNITTNVTVPISTLYLQLCIRPSHYGKNFSWNHTPCYIDSILIEHSKKINLLKIGILENRPAE